MRPWVSIWENALISMEVTMEIVTVTESVSSMWYPSQLPAHDICTTKMMTEKFLKFQKAETICSWHISTSTHITYTPTCWHIPDMTSNLPHPVHTKPLNTSKTTQTDAHNQLPHDSAELYTLIASKHQSFPQAKCWFGGLLLTLPGHQHSCL